MIEENLKQKIHDKFVAAKKNGHLKVTHAESKKLKDPQTTTQYWVTFAPSLALKPDAKKDSDSKAEDPFANPDKELVVTEDLNGDGEYKLLLNKFPVVPEHSLLVTSEFKDQRSALTPSDLMSAYNVLCSSKETRTMMSLVKGIWSFIIVDPIAVPHKITNTCRSCKCLKNLYLFRTYCATERIIFCPPSTQSHYKMIRFPLLISSCRCRNRLIKWTKIFLLCVTYL